MARYVNLRCIQTTRDALLQVKKLTGLDCKQHPNWSRLLLLQVAPQLEELQVSSVGKDHMDVIKEMPKLRRLVLSEKCEVIGGDLPLHIHELDIVELEVKLYNWMPLFQELQHLRELRRLDLRVNPLKNSLAGVVFPIVPAGECGLRRLRIQFNGELTPDYIKNYRYYHVRMSELTVLSVKSLIQAHAATLQELHIEWEKLPIEDQFSEVCYEVLQRDTLFRMLCRLLVQWQHDDNTKGRKACLDLRNNIWDRVVQTDGSGRANVVIVCDQCDKRNSQVTYGLWVHKECLIYCVIALIIMAVVCISFFPLEFVYSSVRMRMQQMRNNFEALTSKEVDENVAAAVEKVKIVTPFCVTFLIYIVIFLPLLKGIHRLLCRPFQ